MGDSISITAQTLDWNQEMNNFLSLDSVEMHNPSIGTFTSAEKWSLQKEAGTFLALGSTTFRGVDGLQLTCSGSLEYDPKTESIRAMANSSPLSIEKDGFLFTANSGKINYQNFEIETFILTDSAQMRINDVVASLEEIQFDKRSNSFVFLSKDGFITLSEGEISLPIHVEKIAMIKDPASSSLSLKAAGRVHFSIDEAHVDKLMDKVNQCIKSLY
jgi:hypothetical protein